ncbi:beclin 1 [Saccharomyces eubayanus]|uniref:beclin 1 n=1 Tax=Saccharomyces eubayanus TaxID=1080349 RepID=UPI0006C281D0|nr:VPS30-like protein [Saccharomyces eubayanus]KOG96196.1 VPS30-like protein [Saccharomyces eubayanus]
MLSETSIEMRCQNCHLPLQLDPSLEGLSLTQRNLLLSNNNIATTTNENTISNKEGDANDNCVFQIPEDRLKRLEEIQNIKDLGLVDDKLTTDSFVFLNHDDDNNAYDKNDININRQGDDSDGDSDKNDNSDASGRNSSFRDHEEEEQEITDGDENQQLQLNSKTLSTQVNAMTNVFNILSSQTNIDYPVCQDCCNLLIHRLKSEYDDAIKERDTYAQFLSKLETQNKEISNAITHKQYSNNILENKNLQEEKQELLKQLLRLETMDNDLDEELSHLQERKIQLQNEKLQKLSDQNLMDLNNIQFNKNLQSLKLQYELSLNHLDKLRKINIFNATFKISHNGPFATINGLRLGSIPETVVPWKEINAALGQLILLLATINKNLKINLLDYKLQPMGSFSKIKKRINSNVENNNNTTSDSPGGWLILPVYNDENFNLGKIFHKETKFDKSLETILEIIIQMTQQLSTIASSFSSQTRLSNQDASSLNINGNTNNDASILELPYMMNKEKINGLSVKLHGSNPNLEWTTAMKFLLTNIKWLLAFSSNLLSKSMTLSPANDDNDINTTGN